MKRVLAALAASLIAQPALALTPVAKTADVEVDLGARLQAMGFAEQLQADPYRSAGRLYLFLKQARLEAAAKKGDVGFYSQLALGGENVYTSNTNLTLLDMYAYGPLYGLASWRVGQFRVPFGRELMSNGGSLAFLDRSIVSPFFTLGRDVGAALQGQLGPANVIAGVFTGGGRDTPQRYLPEILGIPLLVARAGVGEVDADPFELGQHAYQDTARPRYGVAADALLMRDSRVGHSTVLNIKNGFEKSLLLSSGWNPYLAKKDASGEPAQGQLFQAGLDGAARWPLGQTTALAPDGSPIHELTSAVTWFLDGDRLKLVFDLPIQLNVPVATEAGIGSYSLIDQPDQTGLVTNPANSLARQVVVQLRGGLQYSF